MSMEDEVGTTEEATPDETSDEETFEPYIDEDEDGNPVYVVEDNDPKDPGSDPEKGQSGGKDNPEGTDSQQDRDSDTQTDSGDPEGSDERPEWLPENFKSVEDFKKSYKEMQQKVTKLSQKDSEAEGDPTPQEYRTVLDDEIDRLEQLQNADDPDSAKIKEQKDVVRQARADWEDAKFEEASQKQFNSKENQRFREEKRGKWKDDGIELSDDEYEEVADLAEEFADQGKLSDEAFHMALTHKYGLAKVQKWMQRAAAEQERDRIKEADGRKTRTVDTNSSGKSTRRIPLADMSRSERQKAMESMSLEQLNAVIEKGAKDLGVSK